MKLRDLFSDDARMDSRAAALEITGIAMDSRAVEAGRSVLCAFGQQDRRRALHRYRDISSGAVAISGDHPPPGERAVPFIVTSNPRRALALAAAKVFSAAAGTIAAVTGTSGKTSVAAFARQIWLRLGHSLSQHRHDRTGVAEPNHLWIADDARSDRAASPAR